MRESLPASNISKTKLFLSYSRKDRAHVEKLHDALKGDDELEVFRDVDDILPTEEWKPRLRKLIQSADVILFALSPASASSEVCQWEIEEAEKLNKKIIPVVIRDVKGNVADGISKLNYIFLTKKTDFVPTLEKIGEFTDSRSPSQLCQHCRIIRQKPLHIRHECLVIHNPLNGMRI